MKIIVDFDGTISTKDTIDLLLELYGHDQPAIMALEEAWVGNKISAIECLSKQLQLLHISQEELLNFAHSITIDETFIEFYRDYKGAHTIAIVSDGLENIIRPVLEKYGITDCPIYSGTFLEEEGMMSHPTYPYHFDCPNGNGTCKCKVLDSLTNERPTTAILIGDGQSDFCIAKKVHFTFAKDKLALFCREHQLTHQEYQTFDQVGSKVNLISSINF